MKLIKMKLIKTYALIKNYTFDPYAVFFCIIAGVGITLLLGVVGIVMFTDTTLGNPYIIYPIVTLVTAAIAMNWAGNPSAKQVFWGWIILTFGLAAISGIGAEIIYTYKSYTGKY